MANIRELPEYKNGTVEGATRYSVDELREFLEEIPEGKKIVANSRPLPPEGSALSTELIVQHLKLYLGLGKLSRENTI